jgi:hypothetical protein
VLAESEAALSMTSKLSTHLVESPKDNSCLGFDDGALGVVTCRPLNCTHRIPNGPYLNLDRVMCHAAQNHSAAKSSDMLERKMREVSGRVIRPGSPSAGNSFACKTITCFPNRSRNLILWWSMRQPRRRVFQIDKSATVNRHPDV